MEVPEELSVSCFWVLSALSAFSAFSAVSALDARDERPVVEVLERSFLAQPEPLNKIVVGTIAFFILPFTPQAGQKRGPSSWMPWTTSVVVPHAPQM